MLEVQKLKILLGIKEEDTEKDVLLQFTLEDVEETIFNYCNLKELPKGLEHTAYRMAVDLYRGESIGQGGMKISSISEGSTSTSFCDSSDGIKNTLLKDYQAQLNRYRKLRW